MTGTDGSISILKWCNHERRVPTRELMPTREMRDLLEDGETDIDSAEEIIQEEIPNRDRGPLRKRKVEIIPCPRSIEIERELRERPLEEDVQSDESDHLPKERIVTDSSGGEEEVSKGRNPKRRKRIGKGTRQESDVRPKRWRHVELRMKSGEIIVGRISALEKSNMNYFFIDTEFERYIPIDIRDVNEWIYGDNP